MCVYVCIYICIHNVCVYICMCMYVYVYVCMYICICIYVYICMCMCMYMYMYVYIYVYVYMYIYICVCMCVHVYTHMYMHRYGSTWILHSYMHRPISSLHLFLIIGLSVSVNYSLPFLIGFFSPFPDGSCSLYLLSFPGFKTPLLIIGSLFCLVEQTSK